MIQTMYIIIAAKYELQILYDNSRLTSVLRLGCRRPPPPPLPHTKLSQLPTPQILYRTSYVLIYLSLYFSLIHILFSFNLYVTLLFALRLYIAIYSHFFFNIRNPPPPPCSFCKGSAARIDAISCAWGGQRPYFYVRK